MELTKNVSLDENRSLDLRIDAFNLFNHAQFYGPASVDGGVNDPNFGRVVSAAAPRGADGGEVSFLNPAECRNSAGFTVLIPFLFPLKFAGLQGRSANVG